MSRDLKTYERLQAYLNGKLEAAQKEALEAELQTPEARDWLRVRAAIDEAGDQQYREMFKSLHTEMKPKQRRRKLLVWTTISAAAVIAVFLIIRGLFFANPSSDRESLYAQNYRKPGAIERGDGVAVEDPVDLMDELEQKDTLTPLENRSLGIAYMETKQFEKAIRSFEKIGYETFMKDEALWYQALAALKLGRLKDSATYLESLLHDPRTAKTTLKPQAEKLLEEIRALVRKNAKN